MVTNPSPCFSITLTSNNFTGFGDMKPVHTHAQFVDPTYKMKYYGTILDLVGFFGPIIISDNNFTGNVL